MYVITIIFQHVSIILGVRINNEDIIGKSVFNLSYLKNSKHTNSKIYKCTSCVCLKNEIERLSTEIKSMVEIINILQNERKKI